MVIFSVSKMLHKEQSVQVCDATMFNNSNTVKYKKYLLIIVIIFFSQPKRNIHQRY